MMVYVLFYIALMCLSSFKAEQCEDCGTEFDRTYVLEGEPVYLKCPQCGLKNDYDLNIAYNITWHKKGINTSVTTDILSRTHVEQNMIEFYPARSEDAGYYECVKRNSTSCQKKLVELIVYKNDHGLCYNSATMNYASANAPYFEKIRCSRLEDFVAENNAHLMWYKECEPLIIDQAKFAAIGFNLLINNVTKEDQGNYTCKMQQEHNGEVYDISQAIHLVVRAPLEYTPPVIIYPKDEKMYVKTGSPVALACNVSYTEHDYPFTWMVKDNYADYYFNSDRVIMGDAFLSTLPDGSSVRTVILNISEVESEDYEQKIFCVLQAGHIVSKKYVLLQPPPIDLTGHLFAGFITLAFVIVISLVTYKIFKVDIVLYYRKSLRQLISKDVPDGKMYDAYVMFPKGNRQNHIYPMDLFVLKVLPEVLEKQFGYKLFIFGRDDLPGEAVANLIDESIKQSRRLIMILTRKTSREDVSEDGFEQHIALYDSLMHSKMNIILIELEEIDYTEMPESIKYIKQKQGTVKWKGDVTDKSLSPNTRFWKKVRYRMPPTPNQSSASELRALQAV